MSETAAFPSARDYQNALLNFKQSVVWTRIKTAIPQKSGISFFTGQGSFAVVTKLLLDGEEWALRLPLKRQAGADQRYGLIAEEVQRGNSIFVPVEYSSNAMEVPIGSGFLRSAVLMKWVSGMAVREYTIALCEASDISGLSKLRSAFVSLAGELNRNKVVHGDLSPDNILVIENNDVVHLQLVDYDSIQILGTESIPSSVGKTPMRHPDCPMTLDVHSDSFPLMIYFSVLSALMVNPVLGVSPNFYDQKFLIDSPTLTAGLADVRLRALYEAAPTEIESLMAALKSPYSETPILAMHGLISYPSGPIVLASDWLELLKHEGQVVQINGLVKRISGEQELVIALPSKINKRITVTITDRRQSVVSMTRKKFKIGDFIRASGKVRVSDKDVVIEAFLIDTSEGIEANGYGIEILQHIQKRIKESLKRIHANRSH